VLESLPVNEALSALLRPELADLSAYVPPIDPPNLVARLDANEAPAPSSPAVRDAVRRALERVALERYPDARATRLKAQIAARTGARPDELLVGTGSDEVISTLSTALARPRAGAPQATVLITVPTFVMYRVTARVHGLRPIEVPLDPDWDLDVTALERAIELVRPNIVYVASPNNPTGNAMSPERLERLIAAARESLVVVDEAYVDFAPGSVREWRARFSNLAILRTLSKIGLAALRVGWLEADAALVRELDKARQPFNVSATSQEAAASVLESAWDDVRAHIAEIVRERARVADAIGGLSVGVGGGFEVAPSAANFLWVKTPRPAADVTAALAARGVLVRSFHESGGRLKHRVRITIGSTAQNDALLDGLRACS
jgi:histidinol-phosphate aminotransferase